MMTQEAETMVLLSDLAAAPSLAARLAPADRHVAWYASMEEMVRKQPLSSIAVLVLHYQPLPKGVLLAALGRLNLEYPAMQKLAVMEDPLPLPVAEFLTACGVDLFWAKEAEGNVDRLVAVVDRMYERTRWLTTYGVVPKTGVRAAREA